jgi:hypothetical protein
MRAVFTTEFNDFIRSPAVRINARKYKSRQRCFKRGYICEKKFILLCTYSSKEDFFAEKFKIM